MSERLRFVAATMAFGLGSLTVNACHSEHTADAPTIPRCLDQPLDEVTTTTVSLPPMPEFPEQQPGESNKHYLDRLRANEAALDEYEAAFDQAHASPPTIKVTMNKYGDPEGESIYPKDELEEKATNALVEITAKNWKGTGFVVQKDGKQYVVTAAHVVGTATMDQLTFTTQDGEHYHPSYGCYMFEDSGKFNKVTKDLGKDEASHPTQETDVAVLALSEPITDYPLELATERPNPGTWLNFVNYQADYGPEDSKFGSDFLERPAAYRGIVVRDVLPSYAIPMITGLRDFGHPMTNGEYDSVHFTGGGSGGPVLDDNGRVVGISVSGTRDSIFMDAETLRVVDGVEFPGADIKENGSFYPTDANIVPASIIQLALDSRTLYQSK